MNVEDFIKEVQETLKISDDKILDKIKEYVSQMKPEFQWYRDTGDYYWGVESLMFLSYSDRSIIRSIIPKHHKRRLNPLYENYKEAKRILIDDWKTNLITKDRSNIDNEVLDELESYILLKYNENLSLITREFPEYMTNDIVYEWLNKLIDTNHFGNNTRYVIDFISRDHLNNVEEFVTEVVMWMSMDLQLDKSLILDSFKLFPVKMSIEINESEITAKILEEIRPKTSTMIVIDYSFDNYNGAALREIEEILGLWYIRCFKGIIGYDSPAIVSDERNRGTRTIEINVNKLKPIGLRAMNLQEELSKAIYEMKCRPNGELYHVAKSSFEKLNNH